METKVTTWSLTHLLKKKPNINLKPEYQRGPVWNDNKRAILVDSILRGIDIPKIYLRELQDQPYEFETADGQQRIKAIEKFKNNEFPLLNKKVKGLDLSEIENTKVGGLYYDELPNTLKKKFNDYQATIAIVEQAGEDEIRTLFGRLQEGASLNPAEKRNAIVSKTGTIVDNFVLNHDFFDNSKIPKMRFKRQDFLAHTLTLVAYANNEDLKSGLIHNLYLDESINWKQKDLKTIARILDIMKEVDKKSNTIIHKKFNFIDIFWFLYRNKGSLATINITGFSNDLDKNESERIKYHGNPEYLIESEKPSKKEKLLYNYIMAFKYAGAKAENIKHRQNFYDFHYKKHLTNGDS